MIETAGFSQAFSLSGQVALVTGAGRGIGQATALLLARAGAAVVLIGRSVGPLEQTHDRIQAGGGRALALVADVANEASVVNLVALTDQAFGHIDILVNNAGIVRGGPLSSTDPAEWDAVLSVNLGGAFLCARAVYPLMKARGSGVMVNVASISAQTGGLSANASYAASKGGSISLTKALARQMAPWGRANAVAPGQIATSMGARDPERLRRVAELTPLARLGEPEEVARAILFLSSPASSYVTGHTLNINGGLFMD